MTCGGCSGAVTKALTKAQKDGAGIDNFSVDLPSQIVEVTGDISQADLTAKIAKTGKQVGLQSCSKSLSLLLTIH